MLDPKDDQPIEVACTNPEYANGLSLYAHRICQEYAREKHDSKDELFLIEAKRALMEEINAITAHATSRKRGRKRKTRKRDARIASKSVTKQNETVSEKRSGKTGTPVSEQVGERRRKRFRLECQAACQ